MNMHPCMLKKVDSMLKSNRCIISRCINVQYCMVMLTGPATCRKIDVQLYLFIIDWSLSYDDGNICKKLQLQYKLTCNKDFIILTWYW